MKVNRSEFLIVLATGVGGALTFPSSLLAAGGSREPVQADLEGFRSLVDTVFRAAGPRGTVDLVLTAVEERTFGRPGDPVRSRQFSLEFRAADGTPLREGAYSVDHDQLGTFLLFVTPTRTDASGARYFRADFNQLLETPGATRRLQPPSRDTNGNERPTRRSS